MRKFVFFFGLALLFSVGWTPSALASCESDEVTCKSSCSVGYTSCYNGCSGDASCQASCLSLYTPCETGCTETADSCADEETAAATASGEKAAASEGTATSDTIRYETVSQSTYFAELRKRGITFAYVSTKCETTGECTLEDIMQVFTNIANFILGIVGTMALAVTVYGGFLWLTSQGSSEAIEKGKTAMTGSVVGLLIVFGAFAGINFLTSAFRDGKSGQTNKCELVSPDLGGMAGTGYACLNTDGLDTATDYTCTPTDLCPGDKIQCCIKKEPTK